MEYTFSRTVVDTTDPPRKILTNPDIEPVGRPFAARHQVAWRDERVRTASSGHRFAVMS